MYWLHKVTILICLFAMSIVGAAQATPRDYSISLPRVSYAEDGVAAIVNFSITNQGGAAREASQIIIIENLTGRIWVEEILPALAANEERAFSIPVPLAELPEGDLFFEIEAGIDSFELAGSPIARNNRQLFRINKADARAGNNSVAGSPAPAQPSYDLFIPLVNIGINFGADGIQLNDNRYGSGEILLGVVLLAVALFCLWLLSLILRLIFRRPPAFDTWQPPYAVNNWYDPNSALGRRQSWQFHAQNNSISGPCIPEQVTVIKRLLDRDGVALGCWKVKAARTVQYDIYGRINRTEVTMPRKIINQLNRVQRRAPDYSNPELRKAVAPIAKSLSKYALSAIEKQNRMLPIALDLRFESINEEMRILFELYQCRNDAWHLIDQWEPEMGQVGSRVPEQYSFTLNGQLPGENYREYKWRLREEVTQLLSGMFYHHQAEEQLNDTNPVVLEQEAPASAEAVPSDNAV